MVKDGLHTEWYENGEKKSDGTFKDGKLDGLYTSWSENGQKKGEGTYKDGEFDGLLTKWHENGQKEYEWNYKDGKEVSSTSESSSGSSSSYSTSSYKYYCDECGDGISGQPYQCVFYKCTKARTVASGLDTFCSCSCGVKHMRRDGFQYSCN